MWVWCLVENPAFQLGDFAFDGGDDGFLVGVEGFVFYAEGGDAALAEALCVNQNV